MLKNYLKIAFRNIWKRKGYSLINITGLSIGIAVAILITLYAVNELTYDQFHENADDIYMVYKERITPTGTQDTYDTWVPLKMEMEKTFPGVKRAARTFNQNVWMETGTKKFQEIVTYTDPELFEMLSLPLALGNTDNPFPALQSIVISKEIAKKYFGDEDPLGKVFRLAYVRDYVVSGVMEEIPQNSSFQIDMAVQLESAGGYEDVKENWRSSFLNTYIQLREGYSAEELTEQFPSFIAKIWDQETADRTNFKLLPLTEMYDRFNNSDRYAYILLAIALAVMVIAGINFMNMATARSLERVREVGMRKALGGQRHQLVLQFLGESVFVTFIALIIGIGLAETLLPMFNKLYNLELSLNLIENGRAMLALMGAGIFIGLIAGSYPAFYLSRFSSTEVLRGQIDNKPGGFNLRRVLVTVQFAVTIVIIISTLIMRNQVQFMKSSDLGFQQENILAIPVSASDFEDEEMAAKQLATFKSELVRKQDVAAVASSRALPGQRFSFNSFTFARPEGWSDENPLRMRFTHVDHHFFEIYGIKLSQGRNFREGSQQDMEEHVIVNRAAVEEFGWESAEGKVISLGSSGDRTVTVIGTVDNYHYQSLQNEVDPVIHFYRPPDHDVHNFISIKVNSTNLPATLNSLEKQWADLVDASMPMNYFFVDENFNQLYQTQDRLITVAGAFSIVAILIAGLGLLGLASLMVAHRTKEIGIRKVLGASVSRIIYLVTREYMWLVVAGFVIAGPLAYWLMNGWLSDFAYRIQIGWTTFLASGALAFAVALVTVSLQAIKAARMNPVDSLRDE
ncbi:MAG: FtsX-like permease family protein [Balneolaceae bacterium]|nr:FtsX-like permease family protein [Balneolaceae bacterium]